MGLKVGVDYFFIVEGDDNMIFVQLLKCGIDGIHELTKLGFKVTTEVYESARQAEFVGL